MVKDQGLAAMCSRQERWRVPGIFQKLTESLEQSTVKSEQVILPYSPDLLKLSQTSGVLPLSLKIKRRQLCSTK